MTTLTRSTVKMLCVRSGVARKEITEEAQHLIDLYNDPKVSAEKKAEVKAKIDQMVQELENRVTTRRLREAKKSAGSEPSVP
jgi:hypothetical protein